MDALVYSMCNGAKRFSMKIASEYMNILPLNEFLVARKSIQIVIFEAVLSNNLKLSNNSTIWGYFKLGTGNKTIIFRYIWFQNCSSNSVSTIFHPEKNTHYFRYSCLKIKFEFVRLQSAMLNYELHEGWVFIDKNYIRF